MRVREEKRVGIVKLEQFNSPDGYAFTIDRNDLDAIDDEIRLHDKVAEAARKAAKPFVHRVMPESKCSSCNMVVTVRGKEACLASGKTINENSGLGDCAYSPIRGRDAD